MRGNADLDSSPPPPSQRMEHGRGVIEDRGRERGKCNEHVCVCGGGHGGWKFLVLWSKGEKGEGGNDDFARLSFFPPLFFSFFFF